MAAAAPAAPQSPSSETAADGPVLNLVNKRLRALRKKLNRIAQMEDSVSQGKTLNKEQEETLRSKSSVLAGIDELEKLKQPLLQAVGQEIELALEKNKQETDPVAAATEIPSEAASTAEAEEKSGTPTSDSAVYDLLNLLYFGTVFDVKTLFLARDNLLTRTHERNCCLTYDCITDDDAAADLLQEPDLDLIASLGSLLVSRPVNSSLSHKNALQKCVEHAKLWLGNVEQPIEPDSNVTYAGLREKLNKIMASEYFTTTPEIKDAGEVAAAGGNYASFQVPVEGSTIPPVGMTVSVEGSTVEYQQEEEQQPNAETYTDETTHIEEYQKGTPEAEDTQEIPAHQTDAQVDENSRDDELKEQNTTRGGGYYQRNNYGHYRGRGGRSSGGGNYNHHHGPAEHAQVASS
ncbi:glycine-rich protein [Striga hermonthica]|uniref:Glycine-rich protein n=1 Tax=Striga hermonthica TaxID=68872 RepID=A0A9N7R9N1_STRHE|nr:glycine-rich protein [Striga hermonthica]